MSKSKEQFAEQILRQLSDRGIGADEKLDVREIYLKLDEFANALAAQGFFENWQMGDQTIGEGFITTFDEIDVVDEKPHSYVDLPARVIDLPRERGIVDVYPTNKVDVRFIVREFRNIRRFASNPAGSLDGRMGCYRKNNRIYFEAENMKVRYPKVSLRLAIVDASAIPNGNIYPLPADKDHIVIEKVVEWFSKKGRQDIVKDNNDTP